MECENQQLRAFVLTLMVLCSRFRWVQCQIDTLDRCTSVSEIRSVLDRLPVGLEETYRRLLFSIDRRWPEARLVRRALVWLATALWPMRLCELLEAVTIDFDRRTLNLGFVLVKDIDFLEASRSLVIHHAETDIVTLSHMSVKVRQNHRRASLDCPLYAHHGCVGVPSGRNSSTGTAKIPHRPRRDARTAG